MNRLSPYCLLLLILSGILLTWFPWPSAVCAAETVATDATPAALVEQGGYGVLRRGKMVASLHPETLLVPASILKIVTSLAALENLGPDFRFETRFFYTVDQDLIIQGGGDPRLTSEEVDVIVQRLRQHGVEVIKDIVLDDTLFDLGQPEDWIGASLNPYDADNGALVVNFNSIHITVSPQGVVTSAEPQTPMLPLMQQLGQGKAPGSHWVNITAKAKDPAAIALRHAGELFRAMQHKHGIGGQGEIRPGRPASSARPIYVHRSGATMRDNVRALLRYSNNFMANQLFLACGVKRFGAPATWDKGRAAMSKYLRQRLELTGSDVVMVEGSGLSRANRITIATMLHILGAFKPYADLLPRPRSNGGSRLIKSGTLDRVYAYAGYFQDNGILDPVVLILNQRENTRDAVLNRLEQLNQQMHQ